MRVIIAGGRHFTDYEMLRDYCDKMLVSELPKHIISGGASGADALGVRYAIERGIPYTIYKADWKSHGKQAGPIRNRFMASNADAVIVFWNGKSKGTKSMIEIAKEKEMPLRIKIYS